MPAWLHKQVREEGIMLNQPHHDGSMQHVPCVEPLLGQTIPVFVRVPRTWPVTSVHLRVVYDEDPRLLPAAVDRSDAHDVWWRADLPVHNPVTRYRFRLDRKSSRPVWLNGSGVWDHDITDNADFRVTTFPPPPAWTADAVIYQIFSDRFARSANAPVRTESAPAWAIPATWNDPVISGPQAQLQLYGGDLSGIEERLGYLQELGVNTIYLTPFFPAPSSHRYNATTFDYVDPLLGGDGALARLSAAVHQRGMRLLGDLTTNHSGNTHEWFRAAQADPASEEAGFYYFRNHPDDYIAWYANPAMPKFNFASAALRRRLVDGPGSVVARWLRAPYALDGWRIDVANMTGRWAADDFNHEIATAIRATLAAERPDALLLAEHAYDATAELRGDGWHATMNYSGFTGPVCSWLAQPGRQAQASDETPPLPPRSGIQIVRTMREFAAAVPWRSAAANVNLLGSHDTARIRSVVGSDERAATAAGLLLTYPGSPMLYMGDELGLQADDRERARVPMPWADSARFASSLARTYQELIALRSGQPALRHGGLRWAHASATAIAFLREALGDRLLVLATRADGPPIRLPATIVRGEPSNLHGGGSATLAGNELVLPGDGPAFHVWNL
jgi:alpha-glucosidase